MLTLYSSTAQAQPHLHFNRANSQDIGSDVIELDNGDLLLIGSTDNGVNTSSMRDGMLTRMNPVTGAIIWSRAYDSNNNDVDLNGLSMAIQANNGDIVAVGFMASATTTNQSMWFLRVNATTGAVLASTSFNPSSFSYLIHIFESPNPAGGTSFIASGGSGAGDFDDSYLVRLDLNGNILADHELPGTDNWFTEARQIGNTIYACGRSDGRPLIVAVNALDFTTNTIWRLNGGLVLNSLQTANIAGEDHLILGGLNNTRPLFVDFNINQVAVDHAVEYPVPGRITSIQASPQGGWIANIRTNNQMGIAILDDDGILQNHITYDNANNFVQRLSPIANNRIAMTGWNPLDNTSPLTLNITDINGLNDCSTSNEVVSNPLLTISPNSETDDNTAPNYPTTLVTLNAVDISWDVTPICTHCWASSDSTYIRLDPNNEDARITDFGIVALGNGQFQIRNGQYNRLPSKLYLAQGVVLDIEATNNGTTNTVVDLTNSDVVFGAGASIRVQTGAGTVGNRAELIINETTLRPCTEEDTWNGIISSGARTAVSCKASTFINATVGLYVQGNATVGLVADNSFLNCQFGIVGTNSEWNSPITNNTFSVNPDALALEYTLLDEIVINSLTGSAVIWGNGLPEFSTTNQRFFTNTGTTTAADFEGFAGIQLLTNTNNTLLSNSLISQNQFINGFPLGAENPEYNGVTLKNINGVSLSQNRFTNNDRSIILDKCTQNSIENNYMEVTRRATVDQSFYQIVLFSNLLGNNSQLLVKGNTLINSAPAVDLTNNILFNNTATTVEGTGGIYLSTIPTNANVRIVDNEIIGFEVGIYKLGGQQSQIIKNNIQAHLFGIYQEAGLGQIGCNQIKMDQVANLPVTGIFVEQSNLKSSNFIFDNCIRNTDRAIHLKKNDNTPSQVLKTSIQNNYFYNYNEAGILLEDIYNTGSVASGIHQKIRRNAFLSNTGGDDVVLTSPNNNNLSVRIDDNHVGADGILDIVNATGNAQSGVFHGPTSGYTPWNTLTNEHLDLRPFAACGGMDATNAPIDPIVEAGWTTRCDNEESGMPVILSRVQSQLQLTNDYQAILSHYSTEEAGNIVNSAMQLLDHSTDLAALYQTAQQLDLSLNHQQWLAVTYYHKQEDWAACLQALEAIIPSNQQEEDLIVLHKATIDLHLGRAISTDALERIARENTWYKHSARSILNRGTNNAYSFDYKPLKLASKINSSKIIDTYADSHNPVQITPNPAKAYINITISTQTNHKWSTITLYDIHGRLLKQQRITSFQEAMNVETLTQGVYILSLHDAEGTSVSQKFIKH